MTTLTIYPAALRSNTASGQMTVTDLPIHYRRSFALRRPQPHESQSTADIHLLTELSFTGFRLVRPIVLRLQRLADGSVLVGDREFDLYGTGATRAEAIENYEAMLIEQYRDLMTEIHPLGEYLDRQRQQLHQTIIEV